MEPAVGTMTTTIPDEKKKDTKKPKQAKPSADANIVLMMLSNAVIPVTMSDDSLRKWKASEEGKNTRTVEFTSKAREAIGNGAKLYVLDLDSQ